MDVYLVTELMEADLEQIIKSPQALSEEHVRYLAQQMLCGLRHLHAHGVVHRDVKPSNLVSERGRGAKTRARARVCIAVALQSKPREGAKGEHGRAVFAGGAGRGAGS